MKAGATQQATLLLQTPIIGYRRFSESMHRWYVLFDSTALLETQRLGFQGEANGARVNTIYSLGEGLFAKEQCIQQYLILRGIFNQYLMDGE